MCQGALEVVDGLALAWIPAPAGLNPADRRGIHLGAATAACDTALLQPGPGARGAPPAVAPAAPSSICPLPPRTRQLDHRTGTSGANRERAQWPCDHYARHGCLGEHAPDRYPAQPLGHR